MAHAPKGARRRRAATGPAGGSPHATHGAPRSPRRPPRQAGRQAGPPPAPHCRAGQGRETGVVAAGPPPRRGKTRRAPVLVPSGDGPVGSAARVPRAPAARTLATWLSCSRGVNPTSSVMSLAMKSTPGRAGGASPPAAGLTDCRSARRSGRDVPCARRVGPWAASTGRSAASRAARTAAGHRVSAHGGR